ncbi:hypothetical protein Nepgr_018836 [Nepenthes gracilis]|uniref:Uncharacterized protein n=1 Tax=Nepenthes gracilis TaxID=150966 RepID=A0AAD3XUM9_NEPGR|nr:hypothetical protein Nepgr_018836 [Nepenthes gracilis]
MSLNQLSMRTTHLFLVPPAPHFTESLDSGYIFNGESVERDSQTLCTEDVTIDYCGSPKRGENDSSFLGPQEEDYKVDYVDVVSERALDEGRTAAKEGTPNSSCKIASDVERLRRQLEIKTQRSLALTPMQLPSCS